MDKKIWEIREKVYKEEVKAISLIWNEEKFSIEDIALQINKSTSWVRIRLAAAKKMGLVTSIKFKKKKLAKKNEKIIKMWNKGIYTLDEIGQEFSVTRERIRQILKKAKSDGIFVEEVQNVSSERAKNRIHEKASKVNKNEFAYDYVNNMGAAMIRSKYDLTNDTYKYLEKLILKEGIISPRDKVINSVINSYENPNEETIHREKVILEMKEKNCSLSEIADALGISIPLVSRIITTMIDKGIYLKNVKASNHNEDDDLINTIDILLDKGMNMRKISKAIGISAHTVKVLIYRHFC